MKFVLFLVFFLFINISYSQDGILDTSFGNNGTTVLSIIDKSTRGKSMVILNDNSIILGVNSEFSQNGSTSNRGFYVYKLLSDGNVDTTFGTDGFLFFPNQGTNRSLLVGLTKMNSPEILINCLLYGEHKIIKINQNGEMIISFNIYSNFNFYYKNVGIQSNNKIVVPGQYVDEQNNSMYSISRYLPNGTIDTSFGNNGIMITDITEYKDDIGKSIIIQNDDKIIIVGESSDGAFESRAVITRFNENGTLDSSFGNNGTVITSLLESSNFELFNDVKLMLNGEIVVGGNAYYQGGTGDLFGVKPTVVKYNSNGLLDNSFGNQGIVNLESIYGANEYLRTIIIQPNNKIIIGGGASYPYPNYQTDFYISRLNENGTIDTNFGNNGLFLTNFENSETNYVTDLKLQNNSIFAFGCSKTQNNVFRTAIICKLTNENLSVTDYSQERVLIYPNPSYENIFIKSNNPFNRITLYNIQGKLIRCDIIDFNTKFEYSLFGIEKGTYFVSIFSANELIKTKIIIKK